MKMTLGKPLPPYPDFVKGIRKVPEFIDELRTRGRIYDSRFRLQGDLEVKPIDEYGGLCIEGEAFQVMIDNNRGNIKDI